jgi:MoxR-like ATPase
MEGTFPLPEAQLDRFLIRIRPGYPTLEEEDAILRRFESDNPLSRLQSVAGPADILAWQDQRAAVLVADQVRAYLLEVIRSTRTDERVALGASPRAALALHRAVQARAMLDDRAFVVPDDIKALASAVLGHRLILSAEARLRGNTAEDVIEAVLTATPVPVEDELRD